MTAEVGECERLGRSSSGALRAVARPGNGYSPPERFSPASPSHEALVTLRRPTDPVPRASCAPHLSRWPLRPVPLPGELLSFWLARVAWANGIGYWDLFSIVWGNKPCRFTDVDLAVHDLRLEELAARTDLPSEEIRRLGLFSSQIDPVFRHHDPQAGLRWRPWVVTLGQRKQRQSRPGLAYCPWCLQEDAIPFVRREWRYVTTFCCDRHRRFLEVGCPICRFAVDFRHANLERRPWTTCRRCGADVRRGIRGRPRGRLCPTQAMIEAQAFFLDALECERVDLGKGNEATAAELLLMLKSAPRSIFRRVGRSLRSRGQIDRIRKRLLFLGLLAHKGRPAPLRLQSPRARATVVTLFVRMLQWSPSLNLRNAIDHARAELAPFGQFREVSFQYAARTGPMDLLSVLLSVLCTETPGTRLDLENVGLRYRPTEPTHVVSWQFRRRASDMHGVPPEGNRPEAAQADRNRGLRERFLREYGAIDAAEAARGLAASADERTEQVRLWIANRRAFSVIHRGRELLPSFQFDPVTGALLPQVAQLLEALEGRRQGWEIALWMISPNGWLRGRRPIRLWPDHMDKMLEAARREVGVPGT